MSLTVKEARRRLVNVNTSKLTKEQHGQLYATIHWLQKLSDDYARLYWKQSGKYLSDPDKIIELNPDQEYLFLNELHIVHGNGKIEKAG